MQIFNEIIGKYWDPERKLVDEGYTTIPPIPYSQAERFVIRKTFSDTNSKNFTRVEMYAKKSPLRVIKERQLMHQL